MRVLISDPTLRDGNHACGHSLTVEQIKGYCERADAAHVPIVEVGHGNGEGASSLQLGEAATSAWTTLCTAREALRHSLLGIHIIPGFGTIERDLAPAIDAGVDVVRVASHVTEADITERHIRYAKSRNVTTYGVLMMSHMASIPVLVGEARKMLSYGADGVIIMDSSGTYTPDDVRNRIHALVDAAEGRPIGFHGHGNLGLAVANSLVAYEAGARILDGTIRGFGAGAGNTQLEVLVAVLERLGIATGIDLYKILDAAEWAKEYLPAGPTVTPTSIVSGLSGVFSGFAKPVERAAKQYGVDPRDVFRELGRRKVVGGQEDLIVEVAANLAAGR